MNSSCYLVSLKNNDETRSHQVKLTYWKNRFEISIPYISGHVEQPKDYYLDKWFNDLMNRFKSQRYSGIKRIDSGHYHCSNTRSINKIIEYFESNHNLVNPNCK